MWVLVDCYLSAANWVCTVYSGADTSLLSAPSHHILTSYPHPHPPSPLSLHPSPTHTPTVIWQGQRDLHLPVYCYGRLQLCPLHLCCTLRAILFFFTVCCMWKSLYKWAARVRACNSTRQNYWCTKNRTSGHIQEVVYMHAIIFVTIFSTGGKFHPVSNFTYWGKSYLSNKSA